MFYGLDRHPSPAKALAGDWPWRATCILPLQNTPTRHVFHSCALGDGELDLARIVTILRQAKDSDMHVTLEIHSAWRKALSEADLLAFEADTVARSVAYARDVLFGGQILQ